MNDIDEIGSLSYDQLDAYDIAHQILSLWSDNANKSSGMINKHDLFIPLVIKHNNEYHNITDITHDSDRGIVMSIGDNT